MDAADREALRLLIDQRRREQLRIGGPRYDEYQAKVERRRRRWSAWKKKWTAQKRRQPAPDWSGRTMSKAACSDTCGLYLRRRRS